MYKVCGNRLEVGIRLGKTKVKGYFLEGWLLLEDD